MMTHVFGFRHERCLPHAVALGTAMQLTNILRDVKEDFDRGRIYLPADEMARFGVDARRRSPRVGSTAHSATSWRSRSPGPGGITPRPSAGIPDLIGGIRAG